MNDTLSEWTIEKVLDMRKEILDKQKDIEKSNLEIVEMLKLCDEKIEKLSNQQQEKFDSIQTKLDKIVEILKPEVSSEVVEDNNSAYPTAHVNSTQNLVKNEEMISTFGKYFVLKHKFTNVSRLTTKQWLRRTFWC
ncbi:hypothetical protein GCK72_007616 [Caenorhabditis remanei]|uniref:Uncharacterized protein n=1 Tax=Caenorhabditis remanei TaxID=31234 RepID=A0A6A5HMM4_CAERE|nr:hypothetical protein GCK72_007616 [Caenorhabditis remanei]KAF1767657.1 hypothetical protein GCK72_007616 [Caenorhabditis remanei]